MTIKSELLELVKQVSDTCDIPSVSEIYIRNSEGEDKMADFGILALEDGSCGLFYTMLDTRYEDFRSRFDLNSYPDKDPADIARLYNSDNEADRSLGLAAINAITAFVYRNNNYRPDTAGDSLGELNLSSGDHLGMVGYFGPLIGRLKSRDIKVTVLEKKTEVSDLDNSVTLSHDPECLQTCNKVLCTASTMLNNSLDDILQYTCNAEAMVVLGPSAGFFPDPLFRQGVTAIGGSLVLDADRALGYLKQGRGLEDSVAKYLIKRSDYPGFSVITGLNPERSGV